MGERGKQSCRISLIVTESDDAVQSVSPLGSESRALALRDPAGGRFCSHQLTDSQTGRAEAGGRETRPDQFIYESYRIVRLIIGARAARGGVARFVTITFPTPALTFPSAARKVIGRGGLLTEMDGQAGTLVNLRRVLSVKEGWVDSGEI